MEEHKTIKIVDTCPKCGNKEGLITIPGQGMKFYYCPACYNDEKLQKQGVNHEQHDTGV